MKRYAAMRFSIIIPTCNRPQELKACLEAIGSLLEQVTDEAVEVVVTDDGRRQPVTYAHVREFPWVKLVEGPRKGPAANRNFGASMASGEILVFLDDDCIPKPNFLLGYIEFWKAYNGNFEMVVAYGPTIPIGEKKSLLYEAPDNSNGTTLISANFSISKDSLVRIGCFDERYMTAAFEDTEFFERFRRLGGTAFYLESVAVQHPYRKIPNPKSLAAKWESNVIYAFDQGANRWPLYYRFPWHVIRVIISRFRGESLSIQNVHAAMMFLGEWFWVLVFTPKWIAKWAKREPSGFWKQQQTEGAPIPKHGL